jgi:hypothetical protein
LKTKRKYTYPILVFILGIIVTGLFWKVLPSQYRQNESTDFIHHYDPVANRILAGYGITSQDGSVATRYPPGYPIILAGFYGVGRLFNLSKPNILSFFLQVFVGLSTVVLFMLAQDILDTKSGLITCVLWVTYPLHLWLNKQPNSEIPFNLLFFSSLYLLWNSIIQKKHKWFMFFIVGLLSGVSALIRPAAVGLILIYIILMLVIDYYHSDIEKRLSFIMLAGYLMIILPWQLFVYQNTSEFILLSTGGISSIEDGLTFFAKKNDYRAVDDFSFPLDVKAFSSRYRAKSNSGQINSISDIATELSRETRIHPVTVTKLFAIKTIRSWYATDSGRYESIIMLVQAFYLPLILLGSIALWKMGGIQRTYMLFVLSLMIYFWLTTISVLSIVRYMVPVTGLLFTFIPAGFKLLNRKQFEHNSISGIF